MTSTTTKRTLTDEVYTGVQLGVIALSIILTINELTRINPASGIRWGVWYHILLAVTYLCVGALVVFYKFMQLMTKHLLSRPARQLFTNTPLFIEKTDEESGILTRHPKTHKPRLKNGIVQIGWRVYRLDKKKARTLARGDSFRGVLTLTYTRPPRYKQEYADQRIIPLTNNELAKIQKYLLKHFIAPSTLVPVQIKEENITRDMQFENKYYIELHVM